MLDFYEKQAWKVSEVICIKCGYRWIASRPESTLLKVLDCPKCTVAGYTIETGEIIESSF